MSLTLSTRSAVFVLGLAVLAASGCGAAHPAAASPRPVLDGCVHAGPRTAIVRAGQLGSVAVLGRGTDGVVLSDQSDRDLCAWLPFARKLEGAGYRVLLYDYAGDTPWGDVSTAARSLRRLGVRRLFLVGASEGAKASIIAAAADQNRLAGVVSLSAERYFRDGTDVEPASARLRLPILFLTARGDPYAAGDTPALYAACGSPHKRLLRVGGDAHGVDLLRGPTAHRAGSAILSFLAAYR